MADERISIGGVPFKAVDLGDGTYSLVVGGVSVTVEGLDITDRPSRALGKVTADDAAIAALGSLADPAVTDPAAAASVIALLKGQLKATVDSPRKIMTLLTDVPLAAGAGFYSPIFNAETRKVGKITGVTSIGAIFIADKPTSVYLDVYIPGLASAYNAKTQDYVIHSGSDRPTILPLQPLLSTQYRIFAKNMDTVNPQTLLKVYLVESADYENETLFTQILPLDSGNVVLASGTTFTSYLRPIPRVGRIVFSVVVPTDASNHDAVIQFYADEGWVNLVQRLTASKATSGSYDYYVINTDTFSPFVTMSIKNNAATEKTFKANAYGYPR